MVLAGLTGVWLLGVFPVVAAAALAAVGRTILSRRRAARELARRDEAVPDLIDLFAIAAAAGHTAHGCVHAVAPRAPQPVQPVMVRASLRLKEGEPIRDVLPDTGAELGPLGRPLAAALVAGAASGAPMADGLGQVSEAAREVRRRRAEEQARRLPVTLLFPLVLCILPAFLLLAVVPLLVGSLGSLQP
jgi:tight adherence protein C